VKNLLISASVALALAAPMHANEKVKYGLALSANLPLNDLKTDTNNKLGGGLAFQIGVDLGKGNLIRPYLEFNAYRVKDYKRPGSDYQENINVGELGAGADYLYYLSGTRRQGFYLLAGLSAQAWAVGYSTHDRTGNRYTDTIEVTHKKTSLAGGLGAGYQFTDTFGMEMKYVRSTYEGIQGARLSNSTPESPKANRNAGSLQLAATFRW
jgi:hypothetical protein